jgi:hypothetical protein
MVFEILYSGLRNAITNLANSLVLESTQVDTKYKNEQTQREHQTKLNYS